MQESAWGISLQQKLTAASRANFITHEKDFPRDVFHGAVGARPRLRPGQSLQGMEFDPSQDRVCVLFAEDVFSMTLEHFEMLAVDETLPREENAFYEQFIENCRDNLPAKSVSVLKVALDPVK